MLFIDNAQQKKKAGFSFDIFPHILALFMTLLVRSAGHTVAALLVLFS